jgi:hypothetical protein
VDPGEDEGERKVTFPRGLDEIKQFYGDPHDFRLGDGGIDARWEALLRFVQLPAAIPLGWDHSIRVNRIRIHYRLVPSIERIFYKLYDQGLWEMIRSFDGTYVWRAKRSGEKLSTHSWGIAIDLNASTNRLGTRGDMPIEIIRAFDEEDWEWGGEWHRPDPMHFQAAHGY